MKFGGVLLLCVVAIAAVDFNGLGVRKKTLDNLVFGSEVLLYEKYPLRGVTACGVFCSKHTACNAFAVNTGAQRCRIYSSVVLRKTHGTSDHGWKFYAFGDAKCPLKDGFIYSRTHKVCIHLSTETFLYQSGNTYCSEKGAALLSIDSVEKVNAVTDMLSKPPPGAGSYLIGLKRSGGLWRWQNGALLGPEKNWAENHPRGNNECAWLRQERGYKYEDHSCYAYVKPVICEYILH